MKQGEAQSTTTPAQRVIVEHNLRPCTVADIGLAREYPKEPLVKSTMQEQK